MSTNYNQKSIGSGCPVNTSEELNVTVPVVVRGFSDVGDVAFSCMGTSITRNSEDTPGVLNGINTFTVSQRIRIDIPLIFGAEVDVGDGHVEFSEENFN